MLYQKQAGAAGDAPSAAAAASGTAAPVLPEHQNRTPATPQPQETQENPKGRPDLHAGITVPGQLKNSKALLRGGYVRAVHPQTIHVASLSQRRLPHPPQSSEHSLKMLHSCPQTRSFVSLTLCYPTPCDSKSNQPSS